MKYKLILVLFAVILIIAAMGFVWPYIHHKIIPQDMFSPAILPDDKIDSDLDGRPDHLDGCPNTAENHDGYHDSDGCPDDLDSFERCVQGGGRVWPNGNGCTDEYATHLAPYEIRKEQCEKRGGALDSGYDPNTWDCQIPVSDEGKQCTDSSQCKEVCETKTKDGTAGMCTGYHNLGYNSWELKDGKTMHYMN